jgi:hypothetical protein
MTSAKSRWGTDCPHDIANENEERGGRLKRTNFPKGQRPAVAFCSLNTVFCFCSRKNASEKNYIKQVRELEPAAIGALVVRDGGSVCIAVAAGSAEEGENELRTIVTVIFTKCLREHLQLADQNTRCSENCDEITSPHEYPPELWEEW